jgi:hypothetical protein
MGCCTIKTAEPVFWKSPCLRTRQSEVIGHTYVDLAQGTIGVRCRSVGQDRLDIPKIHADRDRPRALGCTLHLCLLISIRPAAPMPRRICSIDR